MIKILTMIMTGNVKQNGSRMDTRGRHGGKYKRMQPYEMYYVNFCHFANLRDVFWPNLVSSVS